MVLRFRCFLSLLLLNRHAAKARTATTVAAFGEEEASSSGVDEKQRYELFEAEIKSGKYRKVDAGLARLHSESSSSHGDEAKTFLSSVPAAAAASALRGWTDLALRDAENRVLVDIVLNNNNKKNNAEEDLKHELENTIGFARGECFKHVCSGYLSMDSLLLINDMDSVRFASLSRGRPILNAGSVESEAVQSMFVDLARDAFGGGGTGLVLDGAGVTVGVISDSFNASAIAATNYAEDVATGDLPPDVVIVREGQAQAGESPPTDEGRAMSQLVYDIAPGCDIVFYSAFGGMVPMARGILALAEEYDVDVLVDDISWPDEPMFQDGILAQAVDRVVGERGIPYFASAGNHGRVSWEGPFVDTGLVNSFNRTVHDFGNGRSRQRITLGAKGKQFLPFTFQWDQPYATASNGAGSQSDLDVWFYIENVAFPLATNNTGKDPIEWAVIAKQPAIDIEIALRSGDPPDLMKWIIFTNPEVVAVEFATNSSTSFGHANAARGAGIGAAGYQNTPGFGVSPAVLQPMSSPGGVPILFDLNDRRLSPPEIRNQPRVVATDNVSTTFFEPVPGSNNSSDSTFRFVGTSAAVANAAAVAILMLQVNPDLSPTEVYSILEGTAQNMGEPGFDFDSGYGFVDAFSAIERALGMGNSTSPAPSQDLLAEPTGQNRQ